MREVLREVQEQDKLDLETSLAQSVGTGLPADLSSMIANSGNVEQAFNSWLHSAGAKWNIPHKGRHPPDKRTVVNLQGSLRAIADNRCERIWKDIWEWRRTLGDELRDKRRALLKQRVKSQVELEKVPKNKQHVYEHVIRNIDKNPVVNSGFDAQFEDIEKMADNQIAYWQAWKVICQEILKWRETDSKKKTKMPVWLRSCLGSRQLAADERRKRFENLLDYKLGEHEKAAGVISI